MRVRGAGVAAGIVCGLLLAAACEKGADVSGTWELKDGSGNVWTLDLTQVGNSVMGTVSAQGQEFPIKGSVDGNTMTLSISGGGHDLTIQATVNGDSMDGMMSSTSGGYNSTFKGRRVSS